MYTGKTSRQHQFGRIYTRVNNYYCPRI